MGSRLEEAVGVAVRAFSDDPFFGFLFPEEAHRERAIARLHRGVLTDVAALGTTRTAILDGHVVGVALWVPPGSWPYPPLHQVRQLLRALRAFYPSFATLPKAGRTFRSAEMEHPKAPHWYLQLLMVDPAVQRQGIGGTLQAPTLEQCDAEAVPSWLETQKEENLAYYRRFGFEVVKEHNPTPGVPSLWSMRREPRT
jgi:GNAT superfamily N-acetyltransferase